METLWILASALSILALAVSPILAIFRSRRRTAKRLAILSVATLALSIWQFSSHSEKTASEAGFASAAEMRRAADAGITDPLQWQAERQAIDDREAAARKQAAFEATAARGAEASRKREAERKARQEAERQALADLPEDLRQEQITKDIAARMAREKTEDDGASPATPPASACRDDLKCWGEQDGGTIAVTCSQAVERLAKYTHEWTDGWLEPKFSHYRWKDKAAGIVTHLGDRVKFQNGFGAWQNMVYECDFDHGRKSIVDVRVNPGRL